MAKDGAETDTAYLQRQQTSFIDAIAPYRDVISAEPPRRRHTFRTVADESKLGDGTRQVNLAVSAMGYEGTSTGVFIEVNSKDVTQRTGAETIPGTDMTSRFIHNTLYVRGIVNVTHDLSRVEGVSLATCEITSSSCGWDKPIFHKDEPDFPFPDFLTDDREKGHALERITRLLGPSR